jgi:hypothetical protein
MMGVYMCLFCVCVVLCLGRGLATSRSLVQGVLPSIKMIMKVKEEVRAHGGCRASEKKIERKIQLNLSVLVAYASVETRPN